MPKPLLHVVSTTPAIIDEQMALSLASDIARLLEEEKQKEVKPTPA